MIKVRRLDDKGDITLGKGNFTYLKDSPETIGQIIFQRFKIELGEWWLNVQNGIDIVTGDLTQEAIDTVIKERILGTLGVTGLITYSSTVNIELRQYHFESNVSTDFGQINIDEVLPI